MMLVLEVVTTALLLFAAATAQKPTNLDDASAPAVVEVVPPATANGPLLDVLQTSTEETGYTRDEVFGKGLDSEENSKEFEVDEDEDDDELEEDDEEYWDEDDLEDEDEEEEEETQAEDESEVRERFKRKIIYRGQGGGGIYSRGSRRGHGGGGDEDPYGRRRDHYGQGPVDSWPYRGQDAPRADPAPKITPSTTGSSTRAESSPVYGTPRKTEDSGSQSSSSSNSSGRNAGKRTKTERRETAKTKLSKNLKHEIAQYAMRHGSEKAAEHFQERVGKKLKVKKIEKFIRRYAERD